MSDLNAQIITMWENGMTSTQIAAETNMTRCAVMGRVHRAQKKGIATMKTKTGVGIMELRLTSCRYVVTSDHRFCGEPTTRGSYCENHAQICYAKRRGPSHVNFRPKLLFSAR